MGAINMEICIRCRKADLLMENQSAEIRNKHSALLLISLT